jgi:adenine deaminase
MKIKDNNFILEGHFYLPTEARYFRGAMKVEEGTISSLHEKEDVPERYFFPGLVDAHVHIESSMLVPSEFARAAVVHGTVATVSDPHEIANVLGMEGVDFMIRNGASTSFKFFFGAPSCVPATPLETSGAVLDDLDVKELLQREEVYYLAEMMNFPGVIFDDPQVKAKLEHARQVGKPIDGHAPGLSGEQLKKYIGAGITTDHECSTLEEAREKAALGMKILIREGSAARNFDTLIPLLSEMPDNVMFCSDDKHPDDLEKGHINLLIRRGLAMGYPLADLIRACTLNPVKHYHLPCGLLRPGDPADFIEVNHPEDFQVIGTFIDGRCVAQEGKPLFTTGTFSKPNRFNPFKLKLEDLQVQAVSDRVQVIGALEGQLWTHRLVRKLPVKDGFLQTDIPNDILKLVVVNRYHTAPPAIGFIHGFGLKEGGLASTVAHDSHNIILLGTDDHWILKAFEAICSTRGGLAVAGPDGVVTLPLPVAGIMSDLGPGEVADRYSVIDQQARAMGCTLSAPFMSLSFMALLVIPELKLGDKGLFDGNSFAFTQLFVNE